MRRADSTTTLSAPFDPAQLMTERETRALLRISRSHLWSMTASGELPSVTIGRSRRYRRGALVDWLAAQERKAVRR